MNTLLSLHDSLRFITPVILMVLGTALHLYAPYHRTTTLVRLRAAQITATEAQCLTQFVGWSAPALTVLGCVLLVLSCWVSLQ